MEYRKKVQVRLSVAGLFGMISRASTLVFLPNLALQKRLNPAPIMTSDLASLSTSLSSIWEINSTRFAMNLGRCYTREQHKMTAAKGCLCEVTFNDLTMKLDKPKTYQKKTQNTSVVGPKNGGFHVHRRSGQKASKLRLKSGLLLYLRCPGRATFTSASATWAWRRGRKN